MSANTWKAIIKVVGFILAPILKVVTPMIKDALKDSLQKLYLKAAATPNPIDDLFVGLLLDLLDIEVPKEGDA